MDFTILTQNGKVLHFVEYIEAKQYAYDFCRKHKNAIVIIEKSQCNYILRVHYHNHNYFIDTIIDNIKDYSYEHDRYVYCITMIYSDSDTVLTIEQDY